MSRDTWDALLASVPLNETAGRVTARQRNSYEPQVKVTQAEWDAPPRFVRFLPGNGALDLMGRTCGRLRVVGYLGHGKWCCRCTCGKYVSRRQKAVLNPANAEVDRCTQCRHTAFLQREASADQTKWRRTNGIIGPATFKDGRDP
jgi:hypothetical protein